MIPLSRIPKTEHKSVSTAKGEHRLERCFDTVKLIIVPSCGMLRFTTVEISGKRDLGNVDH